MSNAYYKKALSVPLVFLARQVPIIGEIKH